MNLYVKTHVNVHADKRSGEIFTKIYYLPKSYYWDFCFQLYINLHINGAFLIIIKYYFLNLKKLPKRPSQSSPCLSPQPHWPASPHVAYTGVCQLRPPQHTPQTPEQMLFQPHLLPDTVGWGLSVSSKIQKQASKGPWTSLDTMQNPCVWVHTHFS